MNVWVTLKDKKTIVVGGVIVLLLYMNFSTGSFVADNDFKPTNKWTVLFIKNYTGTVNGYYEGVINPKPAVQQSYHGNFNMGRFHGEIEHQGKLREVILELDQGWINGSLKTGGSVNIDTQNFQKVYRYLGGITGTADKWKIKNVYIRPEAASMIKTPNLKEYWWILLLIAAVLAVRWYYLRLYVEISLEEAWKVISECVREQYNRPVTRWNNHKYFMKGEDWMVLFVFNVMINGVSVKCLGTVNTKTKRVDDYREGVMKKDIDYFVVQRQRPREYGGKKTVKATPRLRPATSPSEQKPVKDGPQYDF